jgi:hypothetical protein
MIKPNFFIVGAPKSGTTSLFHYLEQHPEIFIPSIKEPRYFIADHILNTSDKDPIKEYLLRTSTTEKNDYLDLYKDKTQKVLGDASIQYLYHHHEVIPKMKEMVTKDVKILIMLRNPVNRAYSNFSHNTSSYEDNDFETALNLEDTRIKNQFNSFWHYKSMGLYSEQVKAFLNQFENVKVVFFEDFINDINETVSDIYRFLEVDSSFKTSSYLVNKKNTGKPKSKWFKSAFSSIKKWKFLKTIANQIFGKEKVKLLNELVDRANLSNKRVILDPIIKKELEHFFQDDIKEVEKLIGRKSNWIK